MAPLDEQSIGQLRRSSAILNVALATPKLDSTTIFGIFEAHLRLTRCPNYITSGEGGAANWYEIGEQREQRVTEISEKSLPSPLSRSILS